MRDADVTLIWPGCLQAALDSACGRTEEGLALHARRERQLWVCYERLVVNETLASPGCVEDSTATPARCYIGDSSRGFTYDRAQTVGAYLWSLRAGDGQFVCPLAPYEEPVKPLSAEEQMWVKPARQRTHNSAAAESLRTGSGAPAASSSFSSSSSGRRNRGEAVREEGRSAAEGEVFGEEDEGEEARGGPKGALHWLNQQAPAPREWTVSRGAADYEMLMGVRIPDEAEFANSVTRLATTIGEGIGVSGLNVDTSGKAPAQAKAPAHTGPIDPQDPEEATAPRVRVRLRVTVSCLGFNLGAKEIDIRIALTKRKAHQLQSTVRMLQRRAGCEDCSGLKLASDPTAGPLVEAFKFGGMHVQRASLERLKVHADVAARFGAKPQFFFNIPPLSVRMCSARPWYSKDEAAVLAARAAAGLRTNLTSLTSLSSAEVVNMDAMRDLGGCLGTFETHGAQLSNGISELDAHLLMRYDGDGDQRVVPLHSERAPKHVSASARG